MRALKQFMRERKREMLACGDCECRTLKCWREATCVCDEGTTPPTPTTTYTVQFQPDSGGGNVDVDEVVVPAGTVVETNDNVLVIGGTTVTATAEEGYHFSAWGTSAMYFSPIDSDCTITAYFESDTPTPELFYSGAYYYQDYQDDTEVVQLFSDEFQGENRVDLVFGTDPGTGDTTLNINGYGIYDQQFSEANILITTLESINIEDLQAVFMNWPSFDNEQGDIDNNLITALITAWDDYGTQSNWDAVVAIIEGAAAQSESLITTRTIFAGTVGQPSENSVTVEENYETTVTFSYTPTNAAPLEGVSIVTNIQSDDDSVASANVTDIDYNGTATMTIWGVAEGTATITYGIVGSQDTYTISVTVTPAA